MINTILLAASSIVAIAGLTFVFYSLYDTRKRVKETCEKIRSRPIQKECKEENNNGSATINRSSAS